MLALDRSRRSWFRMCTRAMASAVGAVALLMTLVTPGAVPASASADSGPGGGGMSAASDYMMPANTAFCENQTAGPLFGCYAWEGVEVWFSVQHSSGNFDTSCVTHATTADARAASCSVGMPYGAVATVSIDPGQVPAGYVLQQDAVQVWTAPSGPPDGETGAPLFTLDLADDDETAPPVDAQVPANASYARIMSGSCEGGFSGTVAELAPVALGTGEAVGQASAIEMATSFTTIAVGLDGIIDGPSAVVITRSGAADAPIIACGDIGGVNDQDGELVVMLMPFADSSAFGSVRLAYNPADGSMTDVTIYLGEDFS